MAKKILMVEDDTGTIKALTKLLGAGGYEVSSVWDGTLAAGVALNQKPDLILLDLMLPGKGGLTILEELRNQPETGGIPVIVLSSLPQDKYKEISGNPSVRSCLTKPYDAKKLMDEIKAVIGG